MRQVVKSLISIVLIISGCEKHDDEVFPLPPATEISAPSPITQVSEPEKSSLNLKIETFQYQTYGNMPYRVLVPRNYDPAKNYPLHVFLHGIDERGTDNEQQLILGASNFQVDSIRDNYPAFIIFPQCPKEFYWFSEPVTQTLKRLIDSFVTDNKVNEDKISIGGFSMGAYGTFAMVAQNPGFFEAAVAISGDGDVSKVSSMVSTNWQIFAGEKDVVVSSSKTEKMAMALEKAGASVSFTLFPGADHGSTWLKAFSKPDFFFWIFSSEKALSENPVN
ncbi:MAG: dienelactone hydrolase family protein [Cyclobacteriaceae bacterium]